MDALPNTDHPRTQVQKLTEEGLNDVEIAKIVGVSRQRVHQIRKSLGVSRPRCECGSKLIGKESIKNGLCYNCRKSEPHKICISCEWQKVNKPNEVMCYDCRYAERRKSDEWKKLNRERVKTYIEKVKSDPEKLIQYKLKVKEWNRKAKERKKAS